MKAKKELKGIKFNILYVLVFLFVFGVIFYRMGILSMSEKIDNIDIQKFANSRTYKKDVLSSKRGTIYDVNGNALAQNVSSYTLIARLAPFENESKTRPQHVVDIEGTAEKLSPVLDLPIETLVGYLSKYETTNHRIKQVEFGTKGRGLSEIKKDEIVALNLPGLSFIETQRRYYPYGSFCAYTLGYAKEKTTTDEDGNTQEKITGEMGIESYFDKELSGTDGYTLYQKDRNGYKIAGTKEIVEPAKDGYDIYLTIDSTIQLFVEEAVNEMLSKWTVDFAAVMVADARSGAILASYSSPTFDPNKRNITSYLDKNVAVSFEPGSTMKIFSYMAMMETGKYNGQETYKSGKFVAKDGTVMGDSNNKEGWGTITYDQGFALSSNTAVMNLTTKYMSGPYLKSYYEKLGFGQKTGIELPNETAGKLNFKYETEVLNASFGQGIMTTPVQYIKALTAVANDGILLEPYIISKIVNSDTGEIVKENKRTEIGRVASKETTDKIKVLMRSVINPGGTGSYYKMEGYDLIGKTGTAQVAKENGKGYGDKILRGFAGIFPGDDPNIIIYMAVKNPPESINPTKEIIQSIIKNVSKYKNIYLEDSNGNVKLEEIEMPSYINKNVVDTKNKLNSYGVNVMVLGNGDTIVNQYPVKNTKINVIDNIFLLTNGEIAMPYLVGYSMKDINAFLSLVPMKHTFTGNGYVVAQSIPPGTIVDKNSEIHIVFETKK